MTRLRFLLAVACIAACAVDTSYAQEASASAMSGTKGSDSVTALEASLPVEEVLDELRRTKDWSFIFDSRLLGERKIRRISGASRTERDLRAELVSVHLQLHRISDKTFAITEEPVLPPPAEIVPSILNESPMPIDTVLVMGSSSLAPTVTGSKRLFKLDSDELAFLNASTPAEAIYSLPQSLASITPANTALYASAAGISLADLRGLGPKRTMVLVNGRRRTITTGGNGDIGGVDLGSISEPLLERIEIQNLPGGARFGASSVAGTINFVTKSNIEGLEAGARFGISERGDSEEISLHTLAGQQLGDFGVLTVGLNVTRNEGLIGADREYSAIPYGFALNGMQSRSTAAQFLPGFGGSTATDRGTAAGVIQSDGTFSAFPKNTSYVPNPDGTITPFRGSIDQLYNWAQWQSVILPSDRIIGQMSFNADLSGSLKFFFETEGGVAATDNVLAPLPGARFRGADPTTGDAAVIPIDNPFLPTSLVDAAQAAFGANVSAIVFEHRYAEIGPRRQEVDRRHLDFATGATLGEGRDHTLSMTYRYGRNRVTSKERDRVDLNKLNIALDPVACAAATGCSLVDFFTTPEISRPALDFITIPEITRTLTIEEHELAAAASALFSLDDNREGRAAAGIEFRRTKFRDRDFTPKDSAPVGYLGGVDTKESLSTLDAYAEVETPLFHFAAFPGDLNASLATRLTYSPNFDVATNFEAGVDWRPVSGVAIFTRQHIGERTPDIIEMFSVGSTLENFFVDPCGFDPADQSAIVKANCASAGPLGVNAGFVQTAPLASFTYYGNPNLEPERVRSSAYGVTLSPTEMFASLPGRLQLTATWLEFDIRNVIAGSESALDDCFSSPGFSSPHCGINPRTGAPSIVRDPATRQIVSYDALMFNGGEIRWQGLDLELRYAIQPSFVDSLWLSALHTYTDKVVYTDGGSPTRWDGLLDYPHHRTLASAGVEMGNWSFVVFASRRGKALTSRSSRPEARVPAALYLDLTGRFDVTDGVYIQAGVKNVTDRKPDIVAFNDVGNFAPEYYDPIGRRYTLSFRVNF